MTRGKAVTMAAVDLYFWQLADAFFLTFTQFPTVSPALPIICRTSSHLRPSLWPFSYLKAHRQRSMPAFATSTIPSTAALPTMASLLVRRLRDLHRHTPRSPSVHLLRPDFPFARLHQPLHQGLLLSVLHKHRHRIRLPYAAPLGRQLHREGWCAGLRSLLNHRSRSYWQLRLRQHHLPELW